jgi:ribonuclease PH
VDGTPVLDLCYEEDSTAQVDLNVVMAESGAYIEVQGTAEKFPFTPDQLQQMLGLAGKGCDELFAAQKQALGL